MSTISTEPLTPIDYLRREREELAKHRWISVEKMILFLEKKQGKTLEQFAAENEQTVEEIISQFNWKAEVDWVRLYAQQFHNYHAPRH
ncbi:hypothetical protein COT95_02805 [Candidatus Falkowbacteria bacterium CG10_big_fil_rev_8_21_14_0_10_37_6]|uniref:Uncharacterized protein n=1 Tax=Candidatus Falkowbacteria bacterium CG10_big_fil_rev_8_21_14_0_10_37_6 TaxID=1974563 RepID=A0A2H0V8N4_9BACT|nr:MAG: hypothetical protein COT95_02805 [Candidatus Falkowbacteria bacterium CG10_big_fil_rev_8_21_14_0_10_37_6]